MAAAAHAHAHDVCAHGGVRRVLLVVVVARVEAGLVWLAARVVVVVAIVAGVFMAVACALMVVMAVLILILLALTWLLFVLSWCWLRRRHIVVWAVLEAGRR